MSNILVYALHYEGAFNKNSLGAVTEAARLAGELGGEAHAVVVGEGISDELAATLGKYGAKKVYKAEGPEGLAGPVIDKASTVEIEFGTGEVLRLPTFSGAASLGHVRFYAAQLPATIPVPLPRAGTHKERSFINTLAGLDSDGNVVACLTPRMAVDGVSPLSDCR